MQQYYDGTQTISTTQSVHQQGCVMKGHMFYGYMDALCWGLISVKAKRFWIALQFCQHFFLFNTQTSDSD